MFGSISWDKTFAFLLGYLLYYFIYRMIECVHWGTIHIPCDFIFKQPKGISNLSLSFFASSFSFNSSYIICKHYLLQIHPSSFTYRPKIRTPASLREKWERMIHLLTDIDYPLLYNFTRSYIYVILFLFHIMSKTSPMIMLLLLIHCFHVREFLKTTTSTYA